ncbi:MAG: Gfo/Idh/MocA family oxidoreductase [Streptosporangiales bacterium]|nr:Gfo/Idh/MocA family oxidoreductase [Streptosporangiales bacterium]
MTDSGVVRIGILGAARIAGKALINPAREVPSATVTAVATRDAARAEAFALEHGIPASYGSYEKLLDDPGVDAVYIPLPNALHGAWTLRALEAGKHVLCEKPFAANADEARRVAEASASSGLVVMEAMHYRYHPLVAKMTSLVSGGAIGTPRHVQAWTCWPITSSADIRYLPDMAPGALMDGGCYAIDCLRLLGVTDPEVTGALADPVPGTGVDRALAARLTSPAGLTGWFESAFTGAGEFRADVHVAGDEGHLWLRNFINAQEGTLSVHPDGPSWAGADESPETTFSWQLRAFTAAVRDGEPFATTADSAAVTMRVIDDAYRAAGIPAREPYSS